MRESLFTEIVLNKNWANLSFEDKLKLLQKLEYKISKFQGREEREIINRISPFQNAPASIAYSPFAPEIIKATNTNNTDPAGAVNALYNTSFLIMADDYFHNKASIKSYVTVDSQKLEEEQSKLDLLFLLAKSTGTAHLMETCSYQGMLAKNEGAMYMLDKIANACETEEDCTKFLDIYYNVLKTIYDRNSLAEKYAKMEINFETLNQNVNEITEKCKNLVTEIKTNKIIFCNIKPEVSDAFNKGCKIFSSGMAAPTMFGEFYSQELINNFVDLALHRKR